MSDYITLQVEIIVKEEDPGYVLRHEEFIPRDTGEFTLEDFHENAKYINENLIDLLGFVPWKVRVYIPGTGESKEFYEEEILETNAASIQSGDVISFGGNRRYKVNGHHVNTIARVITIVCDNNGIYTLPCEMPVTIHR